MNAILVFCLMVPLLAGAAAFVAPRGGRTRAQVALVGSLILVVLSAVLLWHVATHGPVAAQMGGWAAPFGITLVADRLSALLLFSSAVVALAIVLFAGDDIDQARSDAGFHGFMQVVMAGVAGAFLTGDVFNLYVWFEVMLIGSFALMSLGAGRVQFDGAVKYIALNLVATVLLLAAIGLLHAMTGTLNLADLHRIMLARPDDGLAQLVAAFFLVAFGIKAALFPVFAWLPASYHTVPVTVSALFAALMTKIGVYSVLRVGTLVFPQSLDEARPLLLTLAVLTLAIGLAGAIAERRLRRLIAWHVVVSVGILMLGVALGTEAAFAAAFVYVVHGMLTKSVLFLTVGVAERHGAGDRLSQAGGLFLLSPWLTAVFFFAALSMIGLPPTPGFWAKLAFVRAGLDEGATVVVVAVLLAGLATIMPMIRVWNEVYWKAPPADRPMRAITVPAASFAALSGLTLVMVAIGLVPAPLFDIAVAAAAELRVPDAYVTTVLGEPLSPPFPPAGALDLGTIQP